MQNANEVVTTVVIEDFVATPGSPELNEQKGQQVEVIDVNPTGGKDWILVRLTSSDNGSCVGEGLVPTTSLKPLSSLRTSVSKLSMEADSQGKCTYPPCQLPNVVILEMGSGKSV